MSLTDVTLCGKTLCSPVIAASGTFGFGGEYAGIVDMKKLGGISGKGLTLEASTETRASVCGRHLPGSSTPSVCRIPACGISLSMSCPA